MFSIKKSLVAAIMLSTSFGGTAIAEEVKGLYVTGNYGSSGINKADWKATVSDLDYKGQLKFEDGSGWETGLGYDLGRVRTELTYGQSNNCLLYTSPSPRDRG